MKRYRWIFIGLFVVALLCGLIGLVPLSFAMKQAGLAGQGIGWQQARGTIWDGQVTGLTWQGEPVGSVDLDFEMLRALSGKPAHKAVWTGRAGTGRAEISAGADGLRMSDVTLNLPLNEEAGLDPQLASLGGSARLKEGELRFKGRNCAEASGKVSTDILRLAAARYDYDWPVLTGPLRCENGVLTALFEGTADDGTHFEVTAGFQAGLVANVSGAPDEVRELLLGLGFRRDGDRLQYSRALGSGE